MLMLQEKTLLRQSFNYTSYGLYFKCPGTGAHWTADGRYVYYKKEDAPAAATFTPADPGLKEYPFMV